MEIVCIVLVVIDVVLIYENYALKMQNDKLITACKIMIDNTVELTKENREILDECEKVLLIEKETINHCKDIISFNKDLVKGYRNEVSK